MWMRRPGVGARERVAGVVATVLGLLSQAQWKQEFPFSQRN